MATDSAPMAINGNYSQHQGQSFEAADRSYVPHGAATTAFTAAEATASASNGGNGGNADYPKDEVGWYFVEQYYTTLSKNPEKLFLFYTKQSQFVSGTETEKAPVCVGQKAINDRIKELDFQDCKVRVTNVDSQGSRSNIVIQVIGEISNKSAPQRKFTQTFVLAEQENGYFVLNDIFRYILEEDEYEPGEESLQEPTLAAAGGFQEPPVTVEETELKTLTSSDNVAEQARDASIVDRELEQVLEDDPDAVAKDVTAAPAEEASFSAADAIEAVDAPVATAPVDLLDPAGSETVEPTAAPEVEPEVLQDPEPTPVITPPTSTTPAQSSAVPPPVKPAAPKTWASMVAGGSTTAQAPPAAVANTSAVRAAPAVTAQPPSAPVAAVPVPSTSPAPDSEQIDTAQSSGSEWQSVGQDHSRKQLRPQGNQTPVENSRGYIKNVNEAVDVATLQSTLAKTADVTYVDINRQKNCAFVDFATPVGYRAAVAANPHEVNGERLYVEERRIRQNDGYPGRYNTRGGPMRGRGDRPPGAPGRGSFQKDGGRGGYTPRGGRGVGGSRGRGGVSQTA